MATESSPTVEVYIEELYYCYDRHRPRSQRLALEPPCVDVTGRLWYNRSIRAVLCVRVGLVGPNALPSAVFSNVSSCKELYPEIGKEPWATSVKASILPFGLLQSSYLDAITTLVSLVEIFVRHLCTLVSIKHTHA